MVPDVYGLIPLSKVYMVEHMYWKFYVKVHGLGWRIRRHGDIDVELSGVGTFASSTSTCSAGNNVKHYIMETLLRALHVAFIASTTCSACNNACKGRDHEICLLFYALDPLGSLKGLWVSHVPEILQ